MVRITTSEARKSFGKTLNRVAGKQERIILRRRGKDVAAIVPLEDLASLEELEERLDAEEAEKALAEARRKGEKPIPWEKAKRELRL